MPCAHKARSISKSQTFDFVVLQPPEIGCGEYENLSREFNKAVLSMAVRVAGDKSCFHVKKLYSTTNRGK
jgi:hypothetical protein